MCKGVNWVGTDGGGGDTSFPEVETIPGLRSLVNHKEWKFWPVVGLVVHAGFLSF